ncbi:DNA helicase related protein [Yoonia vestfoldensis SKA53]|uniref:DNA helicase related protein n=2 Tax=Yoonia vestfoldensis TaxID=245188 RepID=A3V5U6_9RHOB|nr:DNA helicase related protein [Yoonia vestfoldensis SKA53]
MRRKLQDTSRRNPLINNVLNAKSASFLRIVDEKPQSIFDHVVVNERKMVLAPLPPVDIDPPDEDTTEFKNAFFNAQSTDEAYLKVIEKIDFEYDEKALDKQEDADRALKDRVREALEMPPRPKSEQFSDLINHAESHGINPSSTLPLPSAASGDGRFDDNELQTLLLPKTFQSRLSRILSKARMYQEERGLDVVYIVLGYLKWTLPNAEKLDEFKSPILLLPVTLTKQKSSEGEIYSVTKLSDPLLNPSLDHKLTVEAKLDLARVKALVDTDHINVEELFEAIADLKPKNMQWVVQREASFGIYPFQGIELYHDLDTQRADFSEFPIVSELMVGKGQEPGTGTSGFSEEDVESQVGQSLVPHIVLDADSSQFISLLKVANNENVALEGPPGSGKSQTIVNAIANAIYSGKKVLFVAQKVTALEVVLSRLQSLGLHQFVLPLMGGHSSTDEFYEAVEERLAMQSSSSSRDLDNLKSQYENHRDTLSDYIDILTRPVTGTGMTVHQVLGVAVANSEVIRKLPLELQSIRIYPDRLVKDFGPSNIDAMASQVADWCARLEKSRISNSSPWADAPAETLDTDLVNKAMVDTGRASIEIQTALSKLDTLSKKLFEDFLNNPLNTIKNQIECLAEDEDLIRAHDLSTDMGKDEAGRVLYDLVETNNKLTDLQSQLGLTAEKLPIVGKNKSKFVLLKDFVSEFKIQKINAGTIIATKDDLSERKSRLQKLQSFKAEIIDQISPGITIQQILAYEPLLKYREDLQTAKSHLREMGIEGARNELRKTKQLLRNRTQIFSVDELPSSRELTGWQTAIQNAGIFYFMSSTYKSAMQEAGRILVTAKTKPAILSKLDEAQSFIKDWTSLELSNHVNIAAPSLSDNLSGLLSILDELEVINSRSGATLFSALQLLTLENLEDLIGLIRELEATSLSWSDISTDALSTNAQITKIQNSLNALTEAESVFVSLGNVSPIKLMVLISNSETIEKLLDKRAELIAELDPEFEDNGVAKKILEAHLDYAELSESVVSVLFNEEGELAFDTLAKLLPSFEKIQQSFHSLMHVKGKHVVAQSIGLRKSLEVLEQHRADQTGLNNLIARRSVFAEAEKAGLENLVEKMEEAGVSEDYKGVAKGALAASLQDQIQHEFGSVLMQFDGTSLSAARSRIQSLDRKIIEISRYEIANNAIARAKPPYGNAYGKKSEYTELALLAHELQKQRRTPPRKILKRAQNALMELFPCWMMVPSAVAQHLPKNTDFDLVIIDEASQMTPENSISALMRAKNAFIAGDTNQLPPTSFFKGLSVDEDEDEDVTTTEESILELANVQFHPKHRLRWHYRSKHEDLIAFSNHYVYDRQLVIFPSPTPTVHGMGISLVEVNGTFQRGVNPAEAQVMLDAIVQFMKDTPNRSLGVAVMNQSQMEQLEALVLREADSNKTVSKYLDHWATARQGLERFFVKNLENVQGDERDVIFVGTVYGRDPLGKFYQRFGPINGPAGKRRLNVLFTRAKEQIVTFSSIPLGEFNPTPSNEGATLLRRWLEFSATKRLGEVAHNHDRAGHTDSPFEDHVIEAVRSLGYEAVPQVGVSSYFIDIGVKHPKYPLGYICGIECDGAAYHSSKSARDRDRLREEVLNRLGWELYRIWSTDWFRDPLGCREVLRGYLDDRLETVVKNMPKIVQPKPVEPRRIELPPRQPERRPVIGTAPNGSAPTATATITAPTRTEVRRAAPAPQTEADGIRIGTKLSIRYLNGPRAGVVAKFWFQKTTNDRKFEVNGYKSVGTDSPLGEALEGAQVDDIVTFALRDEDIRVQVIEMTNASDNN